MSDESTNAHPAQSSTKGASGLGIASLVIGGLAVLCALIPLLGCVGWPLALVGALLGAVGLFVGNKSRKLPAAGLILSLAAFPVYFIVTGVAVEAGNRAEEARKQAVIEAQPEMTISAIELRVDYEANEVSADARYKGKVVLISGVVDKVARDLMETAYVTFDTGSIFNVQCFFDEEQAAAVVNLREGTPVEIKGRVDGKFGNVLVKECVLITPKN